MSNPDAYFAGLIDGEGSFYYEKIKGKRFPALQVNMTCKVTMDALCAHFGGNLYYKPPGKEGWLPQWRWRCQNRRARAVCHSIRPYMITKRESLEEFVAYWEERGLW